MKAEKDEDLVVFFKGRDLYITDYETAGIKKVKGLVTVDDYAEKILTKKSNLKSQPPAKKGRAYYVWKATKALIEDKSIPKSLVRCLDKDDASNPNTLLMLDTMAYQLAEAIFDNCYERP